jgi:hypothetical protein
MKKFIFNSVVALFSMIMVGCGTTPTDVGTRIAEEMQRDISDILTIPSVQVGGKTSVVLNGRRKDINILKGGSVFETPEVRPIPLPK